MDIVSITQLSVLVAPQLMLTAGPGVAMPPPQAMPPGAYGVPPQPGFPQPGYPGGGYGM